MAQDRFIRYCKGYPCEEGYRAEINKIEEALIDTGVILISTGERVVGQVNGLSVMDIGDYAFGKPSRVTATAAGDKGVTNIEKWK